MTIITIPADLEGPLTEAAKLSGTTPEVLAVSSLRQIFSPQRPSTSPEPAESLSAFLHGYVGVVNGSASPWSEQTGQRYADSLQERSRESR